MVDHRHLLAPWMPAAPICKTNQKPGSRASVGHLGAAAEGGGSALFAQRRGCCQRRSKIDPFPTVEN
jgi:hypothetical protein